MLSACNHIKLDGVLMTNHRAAEPRHLNLNMFNMLPLHGMSGLATLTKCLTKYSQYSERFFPAISTIKFVCMYIILAIKHDVDKAEQHF